MRDKPENSISRHRDWPAAFFSQLLACSSGVVGAALADTAHRSERRQIWLDRSGAEGGKPRRSRPRDLPHEYEPVHGHWRKPHDAKRRTDLRGNTVFLHLHRSLDVQRAPEIRRRVRVLWRRCFRSDMDLPHEGKRDEGDAVSDAAEARPLSKPMAPSTCARSHRRGAAAV